jgi:hypothetical protein
VWAEEAGRYEIDPSTEKSRQLGLEGDESKTDGDPGLELDKDVEIALSLQLAPDCRPEHCESADAVTAAETAKGRPIEGKVGGGAVTPARRRTHSSPGTWRNVAGAGKTVRIGS